METNALLFSYLRLEAVFDIIDECFSKQWFDENKQQEVYQQACAPQFKNNLIESQAEYLLGIVQ